MNIVCSGFRALLRNEEPTLITRFFVWVGKNCGRYICMHVSHTHCTIKKQVMFSQLISQSFLDTYIFACLKHGGFY